MLPDSPLFWADTEGYVESIEHSALTPANATHFTGLGGDELFTPMLLTHGLLYDKINYAV